LFRRRVLQFVLARKIHSAALAFETGNRQKSPAHFLVTNRRGFVFTRSSHGGERSSFQPRYGTSLLRPSNIPALGRRQSTQGDYRGVSPVPGKIFGENLVAGIEQHGEECAWEIVF
jgi:hypothetical protein